MKRSTGFGNCSQKDRSWFVAGYPFSYSDFNLLIIFVLVQYATPSEFKHVVQYCFL